MSTYTHTWRVNMRVRLSICGSNGSMNVEFMRIGIARIFIRQGNIYISIRRLNKLHKLRFIR